MLPSFPLSLMVAAATATATITMASAFVPSSSVAAARMRSSIYPMPAAPTTAADATTATGTTDAVAALLAQAATARKVPSAEVLAAMEALEAAATRKGKGGKGAASPAFAFPSFFGAPAAASAAQPTRVALTDVAAAGQGGNWKIVYSSILKSGYMPGAICEVVSIENTAKGSNNRIRIDNTAGGVLPLGSVVGEYTWDVSLGRMTFGFDTFELGPLKMGMQRKEKTYDFFWADGEIACARSSGGGLTLMRRVATE